MYDADLTIKGESGATTKDFVGQVKEVNADLNKSWNKIKAGLPAADQAQAEAEVRGVLVA